MPDEARKWAEELGWLFDDERFKPNSIAQIHPDVIRDGIRHIRRLLEQNERLEVESERRLRLFKETVAERRALVAYVRAKKGHIPALDSVLPLKIVKAWQALGKELQEAIDA